MLTQPITPPTRKGPEVIPLERYKRTHAQYNTPRNAGIFAGETHELAVYLDGNLQLEATQVRTNMASESGRYKPRTRPSRKLRLWQEPTLIERITGFSIDPRADKVEVTFYDKEGKRVLPRPVSLAYPERGEKARF